LSDSLPMNRRKAHSEAKPNCHNYSHSHIWICTCEEWIEVMSFVWRSWSSLLHFSSM